LSFFCSHNEFVRLEVTLGEGTDFELTDRARRVRA
jgi:hypothetical protein